MDGKERNFDAAAATWDENPGRVKMAQDVARAIRETTKPGPETEVLDFGCGTGLLSLALLPGVRSVTAVDSSRGMLDVLDKKIAAQGLAMRTALVDLEKGDKLPGPVDLVTSSMTFHHLRDPVPVLVEMARILRPGGRIAIADLDSDEGKFHDSSEGVFHNGFDRCTMQKYFEAAGFTAVQNRTAAVMHKTGADGKTRTFTIFLMTAQKKA
ncbi:Methyltransferase type 11 [Methanoregula boonei 6A8]|jgi:ubiquinone/menaquinone biosynthesis C-methylase UbiE|uniref:Methyltransferase type 11 n=1 Tax=Methanoregula boonei (strain DSM 21154 / JCM 14090 / 6A8) TaxID=456442 RepID=A7I702_METB6|nr:class I SAM-dependent methyltransferase [Methanoregula boonei]ABS55513.1 Methyltransferase type 11 [Methanoregula boonei 6A8]